MTVSKSRRSWLCCNCVRDVHCLISRALARERNLEYHFLEQTDVLILAVVHLCIDADCCTSRPSEPQASERGFAGLAETAGPWLDRNSCGARIRNLEAAVCPPSQTITYWQVDSEPQLSIASLQSTRCQTKLPCRAPSFHSLCFSSQVSCCTHKHVSSPCTLPTPLWHCKAELSVKQASICSILENDIRFRGWTSAWKGEARPPQDRQRPALPQKALLNLCPAPCLETHAGRALPSAVECRAGCLSQKIFCTRRQPWLILTGKSNLGLPLCLLAPGTNRWRA